MSHDVNKTENRLQMFAYYGTLQWQILAIFVAVSTLLATLPFVIADRLKGLFFVAYFLFNESFAGLFLIVGFFFLLRNRALAHRWIHWENEQYFNSPQYWIDWIEQGEAKPDLTPSVSILTGWHYMIILGALGALYIVGSVVFLFIIAGSPR